MSLEGPSLDREQINRRQSLFRQERLDQFWRFIAARQRIWHRRFVDKTPPPWTTDPILGTQRFTNVYRELDPGTQYAVEEILERNAARSDRIFNIMLYRLIGRKETHSRIGFQRVKTFDGQLLAHVLKCIRLEGSHPFTGAYMVSGYKSLGSSDKAENVARLFAILQGRFEGFMRRLESSSNAAEAYGTIRAEIGFGNFLAYQVLVDLLYPLRREGGVGLLLFGLDQWAAPGPGALRGIRILSQSPQGRELEIMRWLRTNQRAEFDRLGIRFDYLTDASGRRVEVSLANIQNCLCEFYKYVKISEGKGRARRSFTPQLEKGPDFLSRRRPALPQ